VVGGDEEIALLRDANLAEQRATAAELQSHFRAAFALVLLRDRLDRLPQSRGAINGERLLCRVRRVAALKKRNAAEQQRERDEEEDEFFQGLRIVNHAAPP